MLREFLFSSCVGQLLKVDETGALIKMVKWSELLKIIFSIILQPTKKSLKCNEVHSLPRRRF